MQIDNDTTATTLLLVNTGEHERNDKVHGRGRSVEAQDQLGLLILGVVLVLWTTSGMLAQKILLAMQFDKPLYMTYFNSSLFAIYLLNPFLRKALRLKPGRQIAVDVLTKAETQYLALPFSLMWFLMNLSYNWSLSRTSFASNTILSTSSPLFALLFSYFLLSQPINAMNVLGVVATLGGTVIVSLQDAFSGRNETLMGDIAALASAVLFGLYTPMLRLCTGGDERIDVVDLFGWMGFFSMVLLAPLLLLLHFIGVSEFEMPTLHAILSLFGNGLINAVAASLCSRAVLLTSPLVTSVGLSLMTPAAMIADWLFNHRTFTTQYLVGSITVFAGFILTTWQHSRAAVTSRAADTTDAAGAVAGAAGSHLL